MPIAENLANIRESIFLAARRGGRDPSEITLMAVSKTFSTELIRQAYAAGARVFGESKVQEFSGKTPTLTDLPDVSWHMIGHLQSNKATKAVEIFSAVDSIDSRRLAEKLNSSAGQAGKKLDVLVEINVGGETAKSGLHPDSPELEAILASAPQLDHLSFRGLMTVPPFTDDPQQARRYFRKLRELRGSIASRSLPAVSMEALSMGMSHDFEVAIEEGSTCVRIGTAIFGERPVKKLSS